MLTFAAITPHSPLLVPGVGTEKSASMPETHKSFEILRTALAASRPDTIIVLSPHGASVASAFAFNLCDRYTVDFKEFGDRGTHLTFSSDPEFIDGTQRSLRASGEAVTLVSKSKLDYGTGVPLALLTRPESTARLIPLARSSFDFKNHFTFGVALHDRIAESQKKIAVIASANLSHRLSNESPAGFSPSGEKLDAAVRSALETGGFTRLITLDPELVKQAEPCGFRVILMLLGMLSAQSAKPRILSYEHPFGVGYLCADFELE